MLWDYLWRDVPHFDEMIFQKLFYIMKLKRCLEEFAQFRYDFYSACKILTNCCKFETFCELFHRIQDPKARKKIDFFFSSSKKLWHVSSSFPP